MKQTVAKRRALSPKRSESVKSIMIARRNAIIEQSQIRSRPRRHPQQHSYSENEIKREAPLRREYTDESAKIPAVFLPLLLLSICKCSLPPPRVRFLLNRINRKGE